jgi:general stress protein YciG
MPKPLNKKLKYVFEAFNSLVGYTQYTKDKKLKDKANSLKDEVDKFLFPKKARYFRIALPKKKKKNKIKWRKGTHPDIIAKKLSGHKGGSKTAATHDKEFFRRNGSKAGNTTLARYGKDYYRHIRSKRKKYPKHYKVIRIKDDE